MDVLVMLAGCAGDGRSTALLDVEGVPVVRRLSDQCARFRPTSTVVLTAPQCAAAVQRAVEGAEVREVRTLDEALDEVARLLSCARRVGVCLADVVVPDAVLAEVLDRGPDAGATLVGPAGVAGGQPVRTTRGRVVAAASSHHRVAAPDRAALGVLHLGSAGCDSARRGIEELRTRLSGAAVADTTGLGALATAGVEEVFSILQVVVVRRAEVALSAVEIRAYPWSRPTDRAEATRAGEVLATTDEEQLRLAAAVKAEDGFFTTHFVSPYSRYIARWCARRGLTPDQVTVTSFLVGVLAALSFAQGQRPAAVAGAVLLQASFTLDCVDGQLARYTRRFTARGAWLDSVFDRAKEYLVYAGLAVGAWRLGQDVALLAASCIALQTLRHHVDFAYAAQQDQDARTRVRVPLDRADEVGRTHWEAEPTATPGGGALSGFVATVLRSARRVERVAGLRWLKRIVVLPIGERFAVISLTAAVLDPRVTFLVLLVWGALATLYTTLGRVTRSLL